MIKKIFLFLLAWLVIPTGVEGAVLYLEPAQAEYQVGDTFLTEVRIDTEGECINTIKAELEFSKDSLEAVDFSRGSSIISLWLQPPKINQELGLISFTGGIPGGYCGQLPGDPGPSHILGKIIFQARETTSKIAPKIEFLDSSKVLLNDGLGTPAKLTFKGALFTILTEGVGPKRDEWLGEILRDKIPPESFEIEIHQDQAIFEGKYFIIFQTLDKQTGIDYFEVKEGKRDWQKAESPYLLKDQEFSSIIKVRAVDKAGNERIAEYIPPKPFPYWLTIIILVTAGILGWIIKKLTYDKIRKK